MPNRIFILYATKQFSTVIICYENTDKNILESAILSLPELKYLPSKTRTGILENQEPITRLQQNITCMRDQGRMSVLVTGYPGLSGLIRMRNIMYIVVEPGIILVYGILLRKGLQDILDVEFKYKKLHFTGIFGGLLQSL